MVKKCARMCLFLSDNAVFANKVRTARPESTFLRSHIHTTMKGEIDAELLEKIAVYMREGLPIKERKMYNGTKGK